MPVYTEHAIAAYFAYFRLDRSAYFGKNIRYKLACLVIYNTIKNRKHSDSSIFQERYMFKYESARSSQAYVQSLLFYSSLIPKL